MSRDPQRLPDYLGHILQAIERIHSYVEEVDEVGFLSSKIIQDAVIRNLEVIGEASRNIERLHPEFAAAHPELPLALANDMPGSPGYQVLHSSISLVHSSPCPVLCASNSPAASTTSPRGAIAARTSI